jgi:transcriptional regulator GlxA family with amidase domain
MALHVASQFYMQRHRPEAQRRLIEIAKRESGQFVRRM